MHHLGKVIIALLAVFMAGSKPSAMPNAQKRANAILTATGIAAGVCIELGTSDGELASELTNGQRMLVQALALEDSFVTGARETVLAKGTYGLVSVVPVTSWSRLPYADNLANLVITQNLADLLAKGLTIGEVVRVLAPYGAAYIGQSGTSTSLTEASLRSDLIAAGVADYQITREGGTFALFKKSAVGMDDWTHFDYGPEGNAVSRDKVTTPSFLKWSAPGDACTKIGGYTLPGFRTANGRVFYYNVDCVSGDRFHLIARDAFNGTQLWTKDVGTDCGSNGSPMNWQFVTHGDRIYTCYSRTTGTVVALDAANGSVVKTYDQAKWPKGLQAMRSFEFCMLAINCWYPPGIFFALLIRSVEMFYGSTMGAARMSG